MRKDKKKRPEATLKCVKCGEEYFFDTIEELDSIRTNTPCQKCGFLLFKHMVDKMHAMAELLQSDIHAKELLQQGKYEEFNHYLTLKIR